MQSPPVMTGLTPGQQVTAFCFTDKGDVVNDNPYSELLAERQLAQQTTDSARPTHPGGARQVRGIFDLPAGR